jgi:cyclohexanecarboxylate-CoA ligase
VAWGMSQRLALVESDRNALIFPFTHIGGITWLFSSLQSGCSNILMEGFHPEETPEVLSRVGATLAGSGTVFHQAYLAYQRKHPQPVFPNVRAFPGGGAPKPPALVAEMREVFDAPILSGYGLTEAPILTMADVSDTDDELAASEGKPMSGVELKLVTLEGELAAPGAEGEVRAKAPQLMRGYLDASLDADAFDEEGYFRTGDLGRLDERGNLIVTGRVKDIIIRKGENVSAKEVEDLLYTHPKVADVAVIGLPDPDSGERVCAIVQTAEGEDAITFSEMVDHLKGQGLMTQKLPEQLEVVDTIPRNPAGKVLKHVLRDQYKG